MANVYIPGLRVTKQTTIQKQRQLPLKGRVLVSKGEKVHRDQVVAMAYLPGKITTLNLVNRLSVTPTELPDYMLKKEGDSVTTGEPIAQTQPFFKLFKTSIDSPITGTIENISKVTGQVILREPPRPIQVHAFIDGTVIQVIPEEGVTVETTGVLIQGIFGIGGERWGRLHLVSNSPNQILHPEQIDKFCKDKIVVCGNLISLDVIRKAQDVGVIGIIGAGIRDKTLRDLLGQDLGVAITGTEKIGLTIIVTEGFGQIQMAEKTFEIFKEHSGQDTSISGATQIRAGVIRPEIIIPNLNASSTSSKKPKEEKGLTIGAVIRIIRAPYFGQIGKINALPPELQKVHSGAIVRVLIVEFNDGTLATVPRANVELIEE